MSLEATDYALAALLTDGSVVCWGHPDHGGDSCAATGQGVVTKCSVNSEGLRVWAPEAELR